MQRLLVERSIRSAFYEVITDRSKGIPLKVQRELFSFKYRTIDALYRAIRPSNLAQFQFFPPLVRILGYCGDFHLEHRINDLLGGKDATNGMSSSFTVLLC